MIILVENREELGNKPLGYLKEDFPEEEASSSSAQCIIVRDRKWEGTGDLLTS